MTMKMSTRLEKDIPYLNLDAGGWGRGDLSIHKLTKKQYK